MERQFLAEKLAQKVPLREIAAETGKGYGTVRYWISKHGLEVRSRERIQHGTCACPKCSQTLPLSAFYARANGRPSAYCINCTKSQALERQHILKAKAVEYKGGVCQNCGYGRCIQALEFHHLQPEHKDFSISSIRSYRFSSAVRKELDKCVLLCANCHRETHTGLAPSAGLEPA